MSQLLRFQLYDDPTRQTYTQLMPDEVIDDYPHFGYGQSISVGDDADDPATWPTYRVANLTHLKQESDPDQPGMNRIVCEVFLAKESEWSKFGLPSSQGGAFFENEGNG